VSIAKPPVPLAPRWHTAALVSLICAVALTGSLLASRGAAPAAAAAHGASGRLASVYLPMIVVQWSLLFYVCRIGRPRNALSSLLGARAQWSGLGRASADVALGIAGWVLIKGFELAWARVIGAGDGASVVAILPSTGVERAAWAVVAISAGFCEEVVYRGYLQTQLTAFTGRASAGIALQALLFGVAHGNQGRSAIVRLALYGLAFGVLARRRQSLWPGVVCHVWTDLASGLLRG
jgi:hypothetical protein